MVDKDHTYVNLEDLEEYLYKYYDKKKLLAIKDRAIRKTKEFQILKIKLTKKDNEKKDDDSWEVVDDENDEKVDSDEDYDDNVVLPNGELLTNSGNM